MILAWLVERFLPISSSVDPIAFFRFVCDRMADKVLPPSQQTQQHYISGALGLITLVLPIVIIVSLIAEFAFYGWLFDAIILYLCLQFSQQIRLMVLIKNALRGSKKQLAKDLLQPSVLRDTAPLSEVGLNKANIEMFTLRLVYQQAVVMFCFVLLGPIAALSYRLCYEASQSWNIKLIRFSRFGWLSHSICAIVQLIPTRLFCTLLLLLSFSKSSFKSLKMIFSTTVLFGPNGRFTLAALAGTLGKNISGPLFYKGHKVRRTKFNHTEEVNLNDSLKVLALGLRATAGFLCLLLVISWGLYA
ncbi:cobalamin biosynthesis protein [Glaciecola sp. SC05]|uniref:cobalamin biosynthesis protein CobD/CbiB n=1 Tax=Glaciecola sp. SC05 TaxID=1987355 RepID=UPI0035281D7F